MSDSADTNRPADQRRRIDPRFSPAFQPGYDPHTHRREPPSAPLREEASGGWNDGSVDGWDGSVGAPAGAGIPRVSNSPVSHSVGSATINEGAEGADLGSSGGVGQLIRADQPDEEDESAEWWHRINPWIIVLWTLGVAFIVGGIAITYLLGGMTESFGQNNYPGYAVSALFQMAWFGVPLLIVLGLATITASFVILALRWRRP